MKRFGFIMHPLSLEDVHDFEPGAKGRSVPLVHKVLSWMDKPFEIARVRMCTAMGEDVEAVIQCVPRLPEQMAADDEDIRALTVQAARALEAEGVSIIGLGAFTAIVANHGRMVQKAVSVPVTSGNTFTVLSAVEATKQAAKKMGIDLSRARVVVIGATGSIGRVASELLAPQVKQLTMVGRRQDSRVTDILEAYAGADFSDDIPASIRQADVVFSATSDVGAVVHAEDIRPGCVVCDVARPRDVAEEAEKVPGTLIIEGGIIRLPGIPRWTSPYSTFNNLGLPPNVSFACFAETALRTLEAGLLRRSLGIDVADFDALTQTAKTHGFHLAGLRSRDRQLPDGTVERVHLERASTT